MSVRYFEQCEGMRLSEMKLLGFQLLDIHQCDVLQLLQLHKSQHMLQQLCLLARDNAVCRIKEARSV